MIPEELKKRKQWVNWKTLNRNGKPTKIPFQPNGQPASSTDPATWSTFADVGDQCGFVFAEDDPYIGIDLDGCRNPDTGKLDDWAREVVLKFATYAEVSPSGTGVKMFAISDSIWMNRNKVELQGKGYNNKLPGVEVYDCGRYFAVTGKRLQGQTTLRNVDDELIWLADKFGMIQESPNVDGREIDPTMPINERAAKYLSKMEPAISGSGGHNSCFKAACALVLGFDLPVEDALSLLLMEYNPRCEPQWTERELRHKVNSAAKQPGQRGYLRDAKPADWHRIYVRTPPVNQDEEAEVAAAAVTLKNAAFAYLESLLAGTEELIDTGIPELDYSIGGGLAMGEMVIVAGRPSHGKSAIGLQMVHEFTQAGYRCVIISEEMSALAIGKRTIQHTSEVHQQQWRHEPDKVKADIAKHFAKRADAMIIENCGTVERVVAALENAADEGIQVAVVDYVQLLQSKGRDETERVAFASKSLRRLCNSRKMLVIVLTQMNREIEKRREFKPTMSDLKQSGQLEQDADVIVFGVWPHRIDSKNDPARYEFFIGKNRNRPINQASFVVEFEPARQRLIEQSIAKHENYNDEFHEWTN